MGEEYYRLAAKVGFPKVVGGGGGKWGRDADLGGRILITGRIRGLRG